MEKMEIAALRKADDVYAHYHEGEHYLTAVKRATVFDRERDPFAQDVTIRVPCEGFTRTYGTHGGDSAPTMRTGFASVWEARGVFEILRPGDRVRLCWSMGGHTSDTLRDAGLVGDSLCMEVIRASDTNGRKPLRFLAETYVGPNNTARMCRA